MKIEITKDVANHHTNPDYPTLRVRWNSEDTNFMIDGDGPNWCPRDEEVLDVVFNMVLLSPTFTSKLEKLTKTMCNKKR